MTKNIVNPNKIMIYDIETSRIRADIWWSGKQFINANQIVEDPKIITVAWKWLGSDTVEHLTWDKNHCDKSLMKAFLKEYNSADMVVGQNNDRFDNRWVNARAMKHDLFVNVQVRTFDIMKEAKRLFRLPGYSMKYLTKYANVTHKQGNEGLPMWNMIQYGTKEQQIEYLEKMVDYNVGDIISTEDMYLRFRKYFGHKVHFGVLNGEENYSCPNCGGMNISLFKRTTTPAGTIQALMTCDDDGVQFRLTNRKYLNFLDSKKEE